MMDLNTQMKFQILHTQMKKNLEQSIAYLGRIADITDVDLTVLTKSQLIDLLLNTSNLATEGGVYAGMNIDYTYDKVPEYDVPVVEITGYSPVKE